MRDKVKKSEADRRYREKNKEALAIKKKEWYENNKERILKSRKVRYDKNADALNAKSKIYRESHKEELSKYFKEHYEKNIERIRAEAKIRNYKNREANILRAHKYYYANKEKAAATNRAWANTVRGKACRMKSDHKRRNNKKGGASSEEIADIVSNTKQCIWCGVPITKNNRNVDHLVPVAKGGDNSIGNLMVICSTCNMSKGDKTPEAFAKHLLKFHSSRLTRQDSRHIHF